MHFVQNEDAVTAGAGEGCGFDDVANFLDAVITCRVQFENVVAGTCLDCFAGITNAARFTLKWVLAIEDLGQNTGGGGLAGTAGAREEVGLALSFIDDRIA